MAQAAQPEWVPAAASAGPASAEPVDGLAGSGDDPCHIASLAAIGETSAASSWP